MAEAASSEGILLISRSSWDSFTNRKGETVPAGEKTVLHVYDPDEFELVGPISVPKPMLNEVGKVKNLTPVRVEYGMYARDAGKLDRSLRLIAPVKVSA